MLEKGILAVDVGATNTRMAFTDEEGRFSNYTRLTTPQENFLEKLKQEILKLKGDAPVDCLAISVAGPVENGRAKLTNVLGQPTISISDFSNHFSKVVLVNDAVAGSIAEAKTYKAKDLIYLTFSTGIGVGVIKDGQIVDPPANHPEGWGHMEIKSSYNLPCACGGTDHWESYCSGRNILSYYHAWAKKNKQEIKPYKKVKELFDGAIASDQIARKFIISACGAINSKAVEKLIANFSPEFLVFDGPLATHGAKLFLEGLSEKVKEQTKIIFIKPDQEICLQGAALYAEGIYKNR